MIFRIAAIIIILIYYGIYVLKMIIQSGQGIKTDQMGKGKAGKEKIIEIVMKISTYVTVGTEIISIIYNKNSMPDGIRYIGLCIAVLGLLFFSSAVYTMKDSWRAGVSHTDKTELVTSGVFGISRNPAFLGFDLVYFGIAIMFWNPLLVLISAFSVIMLNIQIVQNEEPFLISEFGEEYTAYAKHVRRYLGKR